MSFLTPWYVLALATLTGPLLLHLLRRTPRGQRPFSSLMFLETSPPQRTRRKQLTHRTLLLLRLMTLALLVLAFTRPFLNGANPVSSIPAAEHGLVILLDTSASMRRESLWQQARDAAVRAVAEADPHTRVSIIGFDEAATDVLTFADCDRLGQRARIEEVRSALDRLAPSWKSTDFGVALQHAVAVIREEREQRRDAVPACDILLVSDLQSGADITALSANAPLIEHWPEGLEVRTAVCVPTEPSNAGLEVGIVQDGQDRHVRVAVTNAGDSTLEQFTVRAEVQDEAPLVVPVSVPPGSREVVDLKTGPSTLRKVVLEGDPHGFDNVAYVAMPAERPATVAWIDGRRSIPRSSFSTSDQEVDHLEFFLETALASIERPPVVLTRLTGDSPRMLPGAGAPEVIVAADAFPLEQAEELEQYVQSGGTVLLVLTESAVRPRASDALSNHGHGRLRGTWRGAGWCVEFEEAAVDDYVSWSHVDFEHPLFQAFREPAYADFTRIQFWAYRKLHLAEDEQHRVLARFETGDAAVVELPHGAGRYILLASSWSLSDSQLGLSSRFAPLLHAMIALREDERDELQPLLVGQELPTEDQGATASLQLVDFAAAQYGMVPSSQPVEFRSLVQPGLYQVLQDTADSASDRPRHLAVNVAPDESRTAPLSHEQLKATGLPLANDSSRAAHASAPQRRDLQTFRDQEAAQGLWRWILLTAVGGMLIESLVASIRSSARPGRDEASREHSDHRQEAA